MEINIMLIRTVIVGMTLVMAGCSKDPYEKAKDEYISGCGSSGVPEELCECAFDKLTDVYSKEDIVYSFNSGRMLPDIMQNTDQALQACMAQ